MKASNMLTPVVLLTLLSVAAGQATDIELISAPDNKTNTTSDAICTEAELEYLSDPFANPLPRNALKIVLDLIWCLWVFAIAGYFAYLTVQLKKTHTYLAPVIVITINNLLEGIFFLLRTVHNLSPTTPQVVYPWGLAVQMFNAINIWMLAYFLGSFGRHWTRKDLIWRGGLLFFIALIFAITVITTLYSYPNAEGLKLIKPIFLVWFEPPQLLILAFTAAAWAHQKDCCNPFLIYLVGFAIIFAAHIGSMVMMARAPCKMMLYYPFYIPLQMIGSGVATWGMTNILKSGAWEKQDRSEELKKMGLDPDVMNEQRKLKEERGDVTMLFSPENLYTVGVFGVLIGYAISGTSMLTVTKPDMNVDPVFRLYGTYHPCILLDYLPGTLAAQPLFGAGILISQFSMLVGLFRTAAYGDAISTLLQAMLFGWYWLLSAFFILVFTFNPSATTVLLHSLPYMLMNVANAFFVITTIVILMRWKGLRGSAVTVLCGVLYASAIIYGTFFMSGKLMSAAGVNLLEKSSADPKALEATEDLEPTFDPGPMIITLMAQAMILSFGYMSPLKHRPLAFEFFSREAYVPTKYAQDATAEDVGEHEASLHPSFTAPVAGVHSFRFVCKARVPLAISFLMTAFVLFSAWRFDMRVHPSHHSHDYHEIFRRQPGSAIVAVGWMIIANFLVAHVILAVSHEWQVQSSKAVKLLVLLAGVVLLLTALLAHAGTIPSQQFMAGPPKWFRSTDWFKGIESFVVGLAIWLLVDAFLVVQTLINIHKVDQFNDEEEEEDESKEPTCRESILKPMLIVELLLAVVTAILLILVAIHEPKAMLFDGMAMLLLLLWSVCDARGVEVIFAKMRVATPVDLMVRDDDGEDEDEAHYVLPGAVVNSIDVDEELELEDYISSQVLGKSSEEQDLLGKEDEGS